MNKLSWKRNFIWTALGNVIYAITQWGVLVSIARIGSPTMLGQFTLALAIISPILLFSNMQLRIIVATDLKNDFSFGEYFSFRIVSTIFAVVVIMLVTISLYQIETILVITFIAFAKIFEAYSDLIYGKFQSADRMDLVSRSMIIKGLSTVTFLSLSLLITRDLVSSSLVFAFSWLVLLVFYDIPRAKHFGSIMPTFRKRQMLSILLTSLPMGLIVLGGSLSSNIPRYVLERNWSYEELGYFGAISYLVFAGNTFISALNQSSISRMAGHFVKGNIVEFKKLIIRNIMFSLSFGTICVLFSMFLGKWGLTIIYGSSYSEYNIELTWMFILSQIINVAGILGYAMTASRRIRVQLPLNIITIIVISTCSMLLIPMFGIMGIIMAMFVSSIIQLIYNSFVVLNTLTSMREK